MKNMKAIPVILMGRSVIIVVAFCFWRYSPAEADAKNFAQKYAESKDQMDRCSMADLTGDTYRKASNSEKYDVRSLNQKHT